ncbi:uncharacterized protein BDV17DRAFT_261731 [Aspergillus undulatus]|uniref:uncharacterized protein n=1 Tax=Aspergillus undulatus TaxID=1810928 RepID=UPI003CCDE110
MSAGAILSQFSNLLNHMESLGPKLSSNIRPNRDQLNEVQELRKRLKPALASIESHLELLLRKAAPTEKERNLADRIRSSQVTDQFDPAVFRKNLVLIFRGPDRSGLDSDKVKIRKAKSRTRCERLRAESHHLILKWAITLQPSAWIYPTVMADGTFDFLIEDLKGIFVQIPPRVAESLHCLKDEEPLKPCERFQEFVRSIDQPIIAEEDSVVLYKRKRTDEDLPTERENDQQMIERRSKGKLQTTPCHA